MTEKELNELSLHRYVMHIQNAGKDTIDQYEKRKAMKKNGHTGGPEFEKTDKRLAKRDRGIALAANALERYVKKYTLEEDAPTNNVGGGGIAGVGVGPNGEPGVPKKKQAREKSTPTNVILGMLRRKAPSQLAEDMETFAGSVVFEVSSSVFHLARNEKRKGKHWRKYLDEDDCFADIREYAHKNPGRGIVLKNIQTQEMCFARYPKKGY